jgi:hypothetical protein
MLFRSAALTILALVAPASAFVGNTAFSRPSVAVQSSVETPDASLQAQTERLVCYAMCVCSVYCLCYSYGPMKSQSW